MDAQVSAPSASPVTAPASPTRAIISDPHGALERAAREAKQI